MATLNYPKKKERIVSNYPQKEGRSKGEWVELVPEIPYSSSLQRYIDFSQQFYFALPVNSLEERDNLDAKNGDVVRFEDKFFIFMGGEE